MADYQLTNKAVADLSDIWNYTYQTWSEKQSDKYYFTLLDTCTKLAKKPALGKKYESILVNLLGYKIDQYIIFYRVKKEKIEVIRILHSRMDIKNRLTGQ